VFRLLIVFMLIFQILSYSQTKDSLHIPSIAKKAIDAFAIGQVSKLKNKYPDLPIEEYPDARIIIMGDINNDGVPDIVVQYCIEQSNGSHYFLAGFDGKTFALLAHARIGGKGSREVKLQCIKSSFITIDTQTYSDDDPDCCPSLEGISRYVLYGNEFYEVNILIESCNKNK